MAKINLNELEIDSSKIFAKKYKNLLGKNPDSKASAVFGTLQIEHEQPASGVIGDILIEGENVLGKLEEITASVEFQTLVISLAVARAADIDTSPRVANMVLKIEKAIDELKKPSMKNIIKTSLQITTDNEELPPFVIQTFD